LVDHAVILEHYQFITRAKLVPLESGVEDHLAGVWIPMQPLLSPRVGGKHGVCWKMVQGLVTNPGS